jgi:hypothetical protein
MANEIAQSNINAGSIKNHHCSAAMALERAKLAQRVLGADSRPLSDCRTWDARGTNLPTAGASDDLGYVTGTLGTHLPNIQTGDLKNAGATTRYAGIVIPVPEDYETGETLTLRLTAGMMTTVASASATIDAQVYLSTADGLVGADICATAAQSINSLTAADKDFSITETGIVAGDMLDVRIAIAVNDSATVTAVIGRLVAIKLLADRR